MILFSENYILICVALNAAHPLFAESLKRKTLHKPNESREAHFLVIPEFTYAISPKQA